MARNRGRAAVGGRQASADSKASAVRLRDRLPPHGIGCLPSGSARRGPGTGRRSGAPATGRGPIRAHGQGPVPAGALRGHALAALARADALQPGSALNGPLLRLMGRAALELGRAEAAAAHFERALQLDPRDRRAPGRRSAPHLCSLPPAWTTTASRSPSSRPSTLAVDCSCVRIRSSAAWMSPRNSSRTRYSSPRTSLMSVRSSVRVPRSVDRCIAANATPTLRMPISSPLTITPLRLVPSTEPAAALSSTGNVARCFKPRACWTPRTADSPSGRRAAAARVAELEERLRERRNRPRRD